jgi:hypothetical protein
VKCRYFNKALRDPNNAVLNQVASRQKNKRSFFAKKKKVKVATKKNEALR